MHPLLAQMADHDMFDHGAAPPIIMMVGGVVCLLVLIAPAVLLILNSHRHRQWDHAERMKSLEMGLPVPPRDAPWAKASVCLGIGLGVPLIAFVLTSIAHSKPGAADELWIVPALVSGLSVLGSTLLAGRLFPAGRRSTPPTENEGWSSRGVAEMKPEADPDAYDVVGRRG
jgi:hypothetical protein